VILDHKGSPVVMSDVRPIDFERDFGQYFLEEQIKAGLLRLCPDLHFDMGGNLGLYHPRIEEWQGVFHLGRHICSMSRGVIPEYDVWALDKFNQKSHVLRIGWRTTFEHMTRKEVPGVTWDALQREFRIDRKRYLGNVLELPGG
jgi:hypothetical protein